MSNILSRMARWLGEKVPTRDAMAGNRWLAPIAHRFLSPELWRFTRRSVPRGVALGLFAGFIIPIGQVFLAAFLALPARANVPVAALVTFITNPFTIPFWFIAANKVGAFVLKIDKAAGTGMGEEIQSGRWEGFGWFFQTAGVTAFGFIVLSLVTAAVGYLCASLFWRVWVGRKLRVKQERTQAGQEPAE